MLQFLKDRQTLKQAREFLAGSRKLLRMHRDVLPANNVAEINSACDQLAALIKSKDMAGIATQTEKLDQLLGKVFPKAKHASLRENVEVFLVAVIVAMGVRTFFVQPFKIPTGSMQPTLYGIYPPEPNLKPYPGDMPSLPAKILGTLLQGKIYKADGYRARGDHIFVDRFTYHFRKPERGEVIVFLTDEITDIPESSRGKFYIKRLIGLGGDTVEISPPYVKVNGNVMDGLAFRRMYSLHGGYNGYVLPEANVFYSTPAQFINTRQTSYKVPAKHLFVLGDNSRSSLDGRFWGALPDQALVGRAVFVYWPFTDRFGLIN